MSPVPKSLATQTFAFVQNAQAVGVDCRFEPETKGFRVINARKRCVQSETSSHPATSALVALCNNLNKTKEPFTFAATPAEACRLAFSS